MSHLVWIPLGAAVAFLASFVLGDLIVLPVDLYYLLYFVVILGFLGFYTRRTGLELREWASRRLALGIVLGVLGGVLLAQGVLSRAPTPQLSGGTLAWALIWRGVAYGAVDGLILLAFPWVVTWRAFGGEGAGWGRRVGATFAAWLAILLVTTAYHLGYRDFRSSQILQPNIGSTIGGLPTLVSANPVGSVVSHVFLHVTAVVHSPETDLFLPPHRE